MDHASELEPEPAEEPAETTEETVEPPIVSRTTTIEIIPVDDGESTQIMVAIDS